MMKAFLTFDDVWVDLLSVESFRPLEPDELNGRKGYCVEFKTASGRTAYTKASFEEVVEKAQTAIRSGVFDD